MNEKLFAALSFTATEIIRTCGGQTTIQSVTSQMPRAIIHAETEEVTEIGVEAWEQLLQRVVSAAIECAEKRGLIVRLGDKIVLTQKGKP